MHEAGPTPGAEGGIPADGMAVEPKVQAVLRNPDRTIPVDTGVGHGSPAEGVSVLATPGTSSVYRWFHESAVTEGVMIAE